MLNPALPSKVIGISTTLATVEVHPFF